MSTSSFPVVLLERANGLLARQGPRLCISICGWADTGKSTLTAGRRDALIARGCTAAAISTDAFMKGRAERNALGISGYNAQSIDLDALVAAIDSFCAGLPFEYSAYDNRTGTKQAQPSFVAPCDVLIVEGIHALHADVASRMHLKVFIDADVATLRTMRHRGNIHKRGMSPKEAGARIDAEWRDYSAWVRPLAASADMVVQVDQAFNYRVQ